MTARLTVEPVSALARRFAETEVLLNQIDELGNELIDLTGKVDEHMKAFAAEISAATGVEIAYPVPDPSAS